jgi:SAM-dependent methyltransferase
MKEVHVAENIHTNHDVLKMLDSMLRDPEPFWNNFYSDRERGIPFFVEYPDENLVSYFTKNMIGSGKVLELGSGNGRNAVYFAKQGCDVDAVDISAESISWGQEIAQKHNVKINFIHSSVYDLCVDRGTYDIVYDSGCLHHIPPHRRIGYIDLIKSSLKPGGHFALTCFRPGFEADGGGNSQSDWEVYRVGSMRGGLAYSKEKIIELFQDSFDVIELRPMYEKSKEENVFGKEIVWAGLFRKRV